MPRPPANKRRKTPDELELDQVIAERVAARNAPPPPPDSLFDSSKFEIAQTLYLIDRINELRQFPTAQAPPLTRQQVRQGIIDKFNSLP